MTTDWIESDGTLKKTFRFADFNAALVFVNRVGEIAEKLQHHPDIEIRYNEVSLTTTTHDAGSVVTQKDHELACAIDASRTSSYIKQNRPPGGLPSGRLPLDDALSERGDSHRPNRAGQSGHCAAASQAPRP